MLKHLIATSLLFSFHAEAFVLMSRSYKLSKPESTTLKFSQEGCPGNSSKVKKAMKRAVEIWNDVPESRLKLDVGGKSDTPLTSNTIPKGTVIVGCGTLPAGAAGVTNTDEDNGSAKITLSDTLYNDPDGATYGSLLTTVTHELGHAIGLNHSKDRASVMTYEDNGWRDDGPSYLGQDDVDGVTYLYPNEKELGGLLGSCSSYAMDGKTSVSFATDFFLGLLALIGLSFSIKRVLRR